MTADMHNSAVQDEVLDIIAQKGMVARDTLDAGSKLADLNISSLDVVEIVFALEDKFDISIPFNANQSAEAAANGAVGGASQLKFNTVGDVVSAVEKLLAAKG